LQNFIAGHATEQIHQVKRNTLEMCADLGTKKQSAEKISVLRSLCGYQESRDVLVKIKPRLMDTAMSRAWGLTPTLSFGGIQRVPSKQLMSAGLLAM